MPPAQDEAPRIHNNSIGLVIFPGNPPLSTSTNPYGGGPRENPVTDDLFASQAPACLLGTMVFKASSSMIVFDFLISRPPLTSLINFSPPTRANLHVQSSSGIMA